MSSTPRLRRDDGLKLALNVAAMLIAFLGLAVADWILGGLDA